MRYYGETEGGLKAQGTFDRRLMLPRAVEMRGTRDKAALPVVLHESSLLNVNSRLSS